MIVGDIGNHSPWVDDPEMMAGVPVTGSGPQCGRHHRLALTAQRAVYRQSCLGVRYRITLVPAFPGLVGSIWELVKVERV